jgi:hypothetical protein
MSLRTKLMGPLRFLRHPLATLESAPSDRITPATGNAAEAAATQAIEDFLSGRSEARTPQALQSENAKQPPAA